MRFAIAKRPELVCLAAVAALAAVPAFAESPWAFNDSGANSRFGWDGGTYNTGKFGSPTVSPNGFYFLQPDDFRAEVSGSLQATDFARVNVDVHAAVPAAADAVDTILVEEWGEWSSDVSSASDFTVQADFAVFRYAPGMPGSTFSLTMPVTFNPDGTWYAARALNVGDSVPGDIVPGFAWDQAVEDFQITVTNTIQVDGAAPTGSWIAKNGMDIVVPEPASMVLVLAGAGLALSRRSRRR